MQTPSTIKRNSREIKQTNLERLGVENPAQSKEVQEKIVSTCLKKYKTERPTQSDYSHGTHRFGTDPTDKQLLEELKKKVEKYPKSQAKNIIRVWTQSDPLKIKTAQDNNLLYIPIWSNKIEVVVSEIEQFFKDHNLELPQPTYDYKEIELFPNLLKKDAKD